MKLKHLPLIYTSLLVLVLSLSLTSCFDSEDEQEIITDTTDVDTTDTTDSLSSNLKLLIWDEIKQFKVKDSLIYSLLFTKTTNEVGKENIVTLYTYNSAGKELEHLPYSLKTNVPPNLLFRKEDLLIEGAQLNAADAQFLTSLASIDYSGNLQWKQKKVDTAEVTPNLCLDSVILRAFKDSIELYSHNYENKGGSIAIGEENRFSTQPIYADSTGVLLKSNGESSSLLMKYNYSGKLLWKEDASNLQLSKKYICISDTEIIFYGHKNRSPLLLHLNLTSGLKNEISLSDQFPRGVVYSHVQTADSTVVLGILSQDPLKAGGEIALRSYNLNTNEVSQSGFNTNTNNSFHMLYDMLADSTGIALMASFKTENASGSLFFNVKDLKESKLDSLNLSEYKNGNRAQVDEELIKYVEQNYLW